MSFVNSTPVEISTDFQTETINNLQIRKKTRNPPIKCVSDVDLRNDYPLFFDLFKENFAIITCIHLVGTTEFIIDYHGFTSMHNVASPKNIVCPVGNIIFYKENGTIKFVESIRGFFKDTQKSIYESVINRAKKFYIEMSQIKNPDDMLVVFDTKHCPEDLEFSFEVLPDFVYDRIFSIVTTIIKHAKCSTRDRFVDMNLIIAEFIQNVCDRSSRNKINITDIGRLYGEMALKPIQNNLSDVSCPK